MMKFIEIETENGALNIWINPLEIKQVNQWHNNQTVVIHFRDRTTLTLDADSKGARNLLDAIGAGDPDIDTLKAVEALAKKGLDSMVESALLPNQKELDNAY